MKGAPLRIYPYKPTPVRIFNVYDCGDEGEIEGMFDDKGNLLGWWSCNDGNWRGEYFDGFLSKLGIEVVYDSDDEEKLVRKLRRAAKQ